MEQFKQYVSQWWKPNGEYDALRSMNKIRIPIIKELLLKSDSNVGIKPLVGYQVLDVGSGGGILAEVSSTSMETLVSREG